MARLSPLRARSCGHSNPRATTSTTSPSGSRAAAAAFRRRNAAAGTAGDGGGRSFLLSDGVRDPAQRERIAYRERARLRCRHGALVRPARAVGETSEMAALNLLQG